MTLIEFRQERPWQRLKYVKKALEAYQDGRLGDASAYKSACLGIQAPPLIRDQLRTLEYLLPPISISSLHEMPVGSFGHCYAEYLLQYKLSPLQVSPHVLIELQDFILGLRYTFFHDVFHVLLGYDTSLVGEYGVWTFVAAQHYCVQYDHAAQWASILYRALRPDQHRKLKAIATKSRRLATQSLCLIAQPFEQDWDLPLEQVRRKYRVHH